MFISLLCTGRGKLSVVDGRYYEGEFDRGETESHDHPSEY